MRGIGEQRWSAIALGQAGLIGMPLVLVGTQLLSLPVILLGAFSIGFAGQAVKVCCDTLVQENIHDDHLGRVFALIDMWVNVCLVSGTVIAAAVIPVSGEAPVLVALLGVLLTAAAAWAARSRWTPRR